MATTIVPWAGGSPAPWTGPEVFAYDRRLTATELSTLEIGGLFRSLVDRVLADPDLLDLQFRGPKRQASLYVGLNRVLSINWIGASNARLETHATYQQVAGYKPAWAAPQPVSALAAEWSQVDQWLDAVIPLVNTSFIVPEGRLHAGLVVSSGRGFVVIDREAAIRFRNAAEKAATWEARRTAYVSAVANSGPDAYLHSAPGLGTGADMLAIDDHGRLLVIEVKSGGATNGVAWLPAQVGLYADLFRRWTQQDPAHALSVLAGMLEQRQRLGLAPAEAPKPLLPLEVVPVAAIGGAIPSTKALPRMEHVQKALSAVGLCTPATLVWRLDDDGHPATQPLAPVAAASRSVDPPFRARMRRHQAWWRAERLRVPPATLNQDGSSWSQPNLLRPQDGARGLNFLTPAIFVLAQARIAQGTGAIDPHRLRNNLLSSQPMSFNLFGPLATDLKMASKLMRALLPDLVQDVLGVRFEYAPEPRAEFLGDRTAFDVFLEIRDREGAKAFIGIETKLTEPFSPRVYDTPRYRALTEQTGSPWEPSRLPALLTPTANQLWRDHLLVEALRVHPTAPYGRRGHFLLAFHEGDSACAAHASQYQALLREGGSGFSAITLGHIVATWQPLLETPDQRAWLTDFADRYVNLDLSAAYEEAIIVKEPEPLIPQSASFLKGDRVFCEPAGLTGTVVERRGTWVGVRYDLGMIDWENPADLRTARTGESTGSDRLPPDDPLYAEQAKRIAESTTHVGFNNSVLKNAIARLPRQFRTKDLSEMREVLTRHPFVATWKNYHALVGAHLAAHHQALGVVLISSGSHTRGALWEQVSSADAPSGASVTGAGQ